MDKSIVWRFVGSHMDYCVGQLISFDGVEGKITSIRSVKRLVCGRIEVIGRYKPL